MNHSSDPTPKPFDIQNALTETITVVCKVALCALLFYKNTPCFTAGFFVGVVAYVHHPEDSPKRIAKIWNIFLGQSYFNSICLGLGSLFVVPYAYGFISIFTGWRLGVYLGTEYDRTHPLPKPS